jgi:endonuclease/exonuclease/phosphatase family metal-dependent hydrolase
MKTVKIHIPLKIAILLAGFIILSGKLTAQHDLKVMTYNIRYDNAGDGENAWPKRKQKWMELVRQHNPDVLCLQEVLASQLDYIAAQLPGYVYAGEGREGERKGEFAPVFVRASLFNIQRSGTEWLSASGERLSKGWDAALPRIFTFAELEWKDPSGEKLLVVNTHLDHVGKTAREESVKKILAFISGYESMNIPVLLTGDFNFTDTTAAYTILESDGRLKDAFRFAQTKKGENTCCGFSAAKLPAQRIDFVFFNAKLQPVSYIADTASVNGAYLSDHLPVVAEMKIAK